MNESMSDNVPGADNQQETRSQVSEDAVKVNSENGNYIAGFVDGEGSFNVSVRKRTDYRLGWKVSASFNISQKDRSILEFIKDQLQCGKLRTRKDGIVYLEVTDTTELYERIIPFFRVFPFQSEEKTKNFAIFSQIVKLLYEQRHLSKEGLRKVLKLRSRLNEGKGRKRKYTLENIELD